MIENVKEKLVEEYICNLGRELNIDQEKIAMGIKMFTAPEYLNMISGNTKEELKNSFDNNVKPVIDKLAKEGNKSNEVMEKHYDLNDFFDCRISHETLHIHVVPKSVKEDIKNMGLKNFFAFAEEKLDDAISKIPDILEDPSNSDIKTVFAVSPLLRLSEAQKMFKEREFDVQMTDNPYFLKMFNNRKIGQASMPKDKFLALYKEEDKSKSL